MTCRTALVTFGLVAVASTLSGQSPIPTQGGRGQGQGARGGAPAPANLPPQPVAVPLPSISGPVTGPGTMFESLMQLPPGDDMAHFGYVAEEYLVSGTANGQPYTTRIVVRKPKDNSRFSGLVVAESMHPSGNAWMFHFTHRYAMASGHVSVEVLTTTPVPFVEFDQSRYATLQVAPGQAGDILAQVGALLKSNPKSVPIGVLPIRKMILAGTSASAAVLINYLPAHMVLRQRDMTPVYDGFLPTSNGAVIRQIDVPMIQVPTMTEVMGGGATTRQDGDAPGDQYRVYEFAGMAHIDSRDAVAYYPNPCRLPISRFPMAAYMSVALDHLWKWIDKGTVPPRADRILVDRSVAGDGSLMALDQHGNPRGGIRNPYVDVPAAKYGVRNEGASPPIPNAHPFVAVRDEAARNQLCGLAGYEMAMTAAELKRLYRNPKQYQTQVARRYDELVKLGWALPVYRDVVIGDAMKISF
jgi:hypothetical protein